MNRIAVLTIAIGLSAAIHGIARADEDQSEAAKIAQNPIANLISVPLQTNTNLNYGPERETQDVLNVQPVIPFSLSENWNLVTRTIVPVISNPAFSADGSRTDGIGDVLFTAFFSPAHASGWIWGAGPAIQVPTHSADLGNDNWGVGPSFAILHLAKGNPWVVGVLINNVWSVGNSDPRDYNKGLVQPFINYNLAKGWYLVSSPIITVDWKARGSQQWTVPAGGGVGKLAHLGPLPVNLQLAGYYNVAKPDFASNWQVRTQVQFLFPK